MDVGLEFIHTHGTVNLMIASHNIDSIKYAISRMDSLNIQRDSGEVFFGQLLGMCDQGKSTKIDVNQLKIHEIINMLYVML